MLLRNGRLGGRVERIILTSSALYYKPDAVLIHSAGASPNRVCARAYRLPCFDPLSVTPWRRIVSISVSFTLAGALVRRSVTI